MKKLLFSMLIIACCNNSYAAQSANYAVDQYVVNSGGNTQSSSKSQNFCSVGEAAIGQVYGQHSSVQAGFFNDYFIVPPTPTVTPPITITMTPIRTFGGEITSVSITAIQGNTRNQSGTLTQATFNYIIVGR